MPAKTNTSRAQVRITIATLRLCAWAILGIGLPGLAASLLPTAAQAGAWTLPEGRGQTIGSASRKVTPIRAWFGGIAENDTTNTSLFVEYGLWDDVTVGMTVNTDVDLIRSTVEARAGAHVRHRLWTGEAGDVVSVQAGFSAPFEGVLGYDLDPTAPNTAVEADIRVLYGRGWQWSLGNSFISSELGLRYRGEGLSDQLRLDLTAGHEPIRGLQLLGNVFSTIPLGGEGDQSVKLSPSIAYTLFPFLGSNDKKPWQPIAPETLQFGVTWDAAQPRNGLEFTVSVWRSF